MTVRWGAAAVQPVASPPKLRWGTAQIVGTAAVAVVPPAERTNVEPGTPVTLTAALQGGGTADSWTWRQISGEPVTLTGTGPTRTFTAPYVMPTAGGGTPSDATVVLGVRATVGGTTSPERQVAVATLPFVGPWFYNAPDTPTWKPTPIEL